jgi:hypothetical protein
VGPSDLGKIAVCPARIPFPRKGSGGVVNRDTDGGTPFTKEGTKLHKYAEDWINRIIEKELTDSPEKWLKELNMQEKNLIGRGAFNLVKTVLKQKKPDFQIVYIEPELKIRDKKISTVKINGDVDLVIEFRNPEGKEKRIIVDWKRTLKRKRTKQYDFQLIFYDELVQEKRGQQNCEKFLIAVLDESEKKKHKVDDSLVESLEEVIQKWKTQETNPSSQNCGLDCPRFAQEPRCEDAELPSLMEIPSNHKRTAFREVNLSINVWNTIATKGVFNHKKWDTALIKSKTETSIFVEKQEDDAVLCDVVGIAIVRSRPEMKKEIEIIIKSVIILN